MRHVIFLDVDGVLLRFPSSPTPEFYAEKTFGGATPNVLPFLNWLHEHFEVRWLTSWAQRGVLRPERRTELARLLNVPEALLAQFDHHSAWIEEKTEAINFREFDGTGKQFRWLDDEILDGESWVLELWGVPDWWIKTDCNDTPDRLMEVWDELRTLVEE